MIFLKSIYWLLPVSSRLNFLELHSKLLLWFTSLILLSLFYWYVNDWHWKILLLFLLIVNVIWPFCLCRQCIWFIELLKKSQFLHYYPLLSYHLLKERRRLSFLVQFLFSLQVLHQKIASVLPHLMVVSTVWTAQGVCLPSTASNKHRYKSFFFFLVSVNCRKKVKLLFDFCLMWALFWKCVSCWVIWLEGMKWEWLERKSRWILVRVTMR